MRKFYFLLVGLLSFVGINTVSADTYIATKYYTGFDEHIEYYNTYKDNINHLVDYWESNHSTEFPYYFIISSDVGNGVNYYLFSSKSTNFVLEDDVLVLDDGYFVASSNDSYYSVHNSTGYLYSYSYISSTNNYTYSGLMVLPLVNINQSSFILDSNVMPTFKYQEYKYSQNGTIYTENFDTIRIPSFSSSSTTFSIDEIEIQDGDYIPTLISLYDGSYEDNYDYYKEVNLNNYSYIALSLKDYNTIPESNSSTYSNVYIKGQLCITPVYNYGLTERKDILTGTQIQGCSEYYNDFTLTRMYILKDDVENHAIYYIKAYDTSKENIIKIDTSIFDITYITTEEEDNPQVTIDGKVYPTLPYNSLTDTATKSEDEGYVSGVTCAVGDFNCYSENNPSNVFEDLFDKPLEMLKSVWGAILIIFELITEFILLLPPTMQGFLYIAFSISIILGIIKILL